jgi:hypothetical protein
MATIDEVVASIEPAKQPEWDNPDASGAKAAIKEVSMQQ